jgi:uncharacterized protein (DUF4415 family)
MVFHWHWLRRSTGLKLSVVPIRATTIKSCAKSALAQSTTDYTAWSSLSAAIHFMSSACVKQTGGNFAMFKNRKFVMPSDAEEAAINRGIAADPDTYEVSREEIQEMRPLKNRGGRPKLDNPKEPVSLRLDADVLAAFRASGDGWQTRMNNALREWLSEHKEHA